MKKKDSVKVPEEAEEVLIRNGLFEVHPERMQKYVKQQEISDEERHRIDEERWNYLDHIHDHFADKTLKPPAKYKEE